MTLPNKAVVGVDVLQKLLQKFPTTSYTFAYGSAIFAQKHQKVGKMVDLIFVVDNPMRWHTENLMMNSSHYSFLKYFGPKTISKIQERLACGVYYNTLINMEDQLIKYGVISTEQAVDDLKNWTHAYISGRLQKPVRDLKPPTNSLLVRYVKQNRLSALRAALLQLPRHTTKFELYHAITELSYHGDSRMALGENPNKVSNIVAGNVSSFDEVYQPLVKELYPLVEGDSNDTIVQDTSSDACLKHLLALPFNLQRCITRKSGRNPALHDIEDVLIEISSAPALGPLVRKSLGDIVWKSSLKQTAQGILTAGIFKSVRYGLDKVRKKASGSAEPRASGIVRPKLSADEIYKLEMLNQTRREEEAKKIKPKEIDKPMDLSNAHKSSHESDVKPQEQHTATLSDLNIPFGVKHPIQETQTTHYKGFITFTVKGHEDGLLKPKVPPPIPPVLAHEILEPIIQSTPLDKTLDTSKVEKVKQVPAEKRSTPETVPLKPSKPTTDSTASKP